MKLTGKIIGTVTLVTLPLFAIITGVIVNRVNSNIQQQIATSAEEQSQVIARAVQAFGEAGEMDGLRSFLANLAKNNKRIEVRAVRAPATVADYGARKGSPAADSIEQEVIAAALPKQVIDAEAHTLRFVTPLVTTKSCLECHDTAPIGSVLGTTSVLVHSDEADAVTRSLITTIVLTLGAALAITVVVLWAFLSKTIVTPIRALIGAANAITHGDIERAERMVGAGARNK